MVRDLTVVDRGERLAVHERRTWCERRRSWTATSASLSASDGRGQGRAPRCPRAADVVRDVTVVDSDERLAVHERRTWCETRRSWTGTSASLSTSGGRGARRDGRGQGRAPRCPRRRSGAGGATCLRRDPLSLSPKGATAAAGGTPSG